MQKSKLTLYIFIALILGVIAGYLYNVYVINAINTKISAAGISIKNIDNRLSGLTDSTTASYKQLKTQRLAQVSISKANDSLREDKLEGFTILSDIFLRLIKMIVGPLVFTTLVVGVAKVGDIKEALGSLVMPFVLHFVKLTNLLDSIVKLLSKLFFSPRSIKFREVKSC